MNERDVKNLGRLLSDAERLAERNGDVGWTVFGIVLEAKIATIVQMIESSRPEYTKEDFMEFAGRMWDKHTIVGKRRVSKEKSAE
jgi:hypothetical protein